MNDKTIDITEMYYYIYNEVDTKFQEKEKKYIDEIEKLKKYTLQLENKLLDNEVKTKNQEEEYIYKIHVLKKTYIDTPRLLRCISTVCENITTDINKKFT